MYNKKNLKQVIGEAVDKLQEDIKQSPWQIHPDIPLNEVIEHKNKCEDCNGSGWRTDDYSGSGPCHCNTKLLGLD